MHVFLSKMFFTKLQGILVLERTIFKQRQRMSMTEQERSDAEAKEIRSSTKVEGGKKELPISIPQVLIDFDAQQKYVIFHVNEDKYFVRGQENAKYHKDAARPLVDELQRHSISYEILGGGRIDHNASNNTIKIYGFSYGFPWKDGVSRHSITCELLKKTFPDFKVEWTDEGY